MTRESRFVTNLYTGGEEYIVTAYADTHYPEGEVYEVRRVEDPTAEEDELVYTAYTKSALDAWIENLYIENYEYDNSL